MLHQLPFPRELHPKATENVILNVVKDLKTASICSKMRFFASLRIIKKIYSSSIVVNVMLAGSASEA